MTISGMLKLSSSMASQISTVSSQVQQCINNINSFIARWEAKDAVELMPADLKNRQSPSLVPVPSKPVEDADATDLRQIDCYQAEIVLNGLRYMRNACALSFDLRQQMLKNSKLMIVVFKLSAALYLEAETQQQTLNSSAVELRKLRDIYQTMQTVIFQFLFNVLQRRGPDDKDEGSNASATKTRQQERLEIGHYYVDVWKNLKILIPELLHCMLYDTGFANSLSAVLYRLIHVDDADISTEGANNTAQQEHSLTRATTPSSESVIMGELSCCTWLAEYFNFIASFADEADICTRMSWGLAMCVKIISYDQCAKQLFPLLTLPAKSLLVELISLHLCPGADVASFYAAKENMETAAADDDVMVMPIPILEFIVDEFKQFSKHLLLFARANVNNILSVAGDDSSNNNNKIRLINDAACADSATSKESSTAASDAVSNNIEGRAADAEQQQQVIPAAAALDLLTPPAAAPPAPLPPPPPSAAELRLHKNTTQPLLARQLLDVVQRAASDNVCVRYLQRSRRDLFEHVVSTLRGMHECGLNTKTTASAAAADGAAVADSTTNNLNVKILNAAHGIKYYEQLGLDHPMVNIKRDLISILGNMCYSDVAFQNQLYDANALVLLLDLTQWDGLNPFIQQWSILALRHALAGNERNQKFIESLQLQNVFDKEEAARLGLNVQQQQHATAGGGGGVRVHDFGATENVNAAEQ